MCDICQALFGHLSDCPSNYHSRNGLYCHSCERALCSGETVITAPSGKLYCADCINELDISELCDVLEVNNALELIEKFQICDTEQLGCFR